MTPKIMKLNHFKFKTWYNKTQVIRRLFKNKTNHWSLLVGKRLKCKEGRVLMLTIDFLVLTTKANNLKESLCLTRLSKEVSMMPCQGKTRFKGLIQTKWWDKMNHWLYVRIWTKISAKSSRSLTNKLKSLNWNQSIY
jgi:hypothetical protein